MNIYGNNILMDIYHENVNRDIDNLKSYVQLLYQHLMKYEYIPERQTKSWIISIRNSFYKINEILENKSIISKLEKTNYYQIEKGISSGIQAAINENPYNKNRINKEVPDKFAWSRILDKNYLNRYLFSNAKTTKAKKYLEETGGI